MLPSASSRPLTEGEIRALRGVGAAINGALYFFIAAAGALNFEELIDQDNSSSSRVVVIVLGIGASICYTMFCYLTLKYITLKPKAAIDTTSALLAPLAASPFYTAGVEGAKLFNISGPGGTTIGTALFVLRNVNMIDGSVKLPARARELMAEWRVSLSAPAKNRGSLIRILVTLYTGVGYSASTTDAIYATISLVLTKLGLSAATGANIGLSYTGAVLGAIATFPMVVYWTDRGIRQATGGGQPDKDPTDQYTPLAAIATAPVILGILGSATSANGDAFARLGTTAVVIRFSSSILYAVLAGIPGLATLFRGMGCCPRPPKTGLGTNRQTLFGAAAINSADDGADNADIRTALLDGDKRDDIDTGFIRVDDAQVRRSP